MANNRLYILDTETGEHCLLAKGWSNGWALWPTEDNLHDWLDSRDLLSAIGGGSSNLKLVTEQELAELAIKTEESPASAPPEPEPCG